MVLGLNAAPVLLEVGPDLVRVRMSWGFPADVPRASIRSVRRERNANTNIGVHGWRGRWLVNGAAGPLVALVVEPTVCSRVLGIPVGLSELFVSVDDPDAVISESSPGSVGGAGSSPGPVRRTWF